MLNEKELKIVDAVMCLSGEWPIDDDFTNEMVGECKKSTSKDFRRGDYYGLISGYSEDVFPTVFYEFEFNQCVKGMSNFAGEHKFNEYVMSDKEKLSKENSDYSFYWGGIIQESKLEGDEHMETYKYQDGKFVQLCDEADEPVELVYTQEMKDNNVEIEVGMKYLDENNDECILIGENNQEQLYVGKPVSNKFHNRYISLVEKSRAKPIETPEQKAAKERESKIEALINLYYLHKTGRDHLEAELVSDVVGALADYIDVK